jgi:hypothetical protein
MTTIHLSDIRDAILTAWATGLIRGSYWYYVRVYPDGSVDWGYEPSQSIQLDEYYSRPIPHSVTVWSKSINGQCGPDEAGLQ